MNVTHGLRRVLQLNPDGLATIYGDRRRTWRETAERVARLAAGLRALGAAPGERVAILALNSDRYLELYLAAAWAGAVIVPLNIRWNRRRTRTRCATAGRSPAVRQDVRAGRARAGAGDAAFEAGLCGRRRAARPGASYEGLLRRTSRFPSPCARARTLRASSTPAAPRAARRGDAQPWNLMATRANGLAEFASSGERAYLHAAPMFHLANAGHVHAAAHGGDAHVMIPAFTPEGVLAISRSIASPTPCCVPTMIQMLVDHPGSGRYDLSSLIRVIYGASPISEAVLGRAMAALPHAQFTQAYGMTEAVACRDPAALGRPHRRRLRQGPPSFGGPRDTTAAKCGSSIPNDQPVPRRRRRRDRGARRQRDDGLLGPARGNRARRSSTAGCIPAMAATWTRTATSSSSTASRT